MVFPFEMVALEVMLLFPGVLYPKGSWGGIDVAARASGCRTAKKRCWAIHQSPPKIRFGRGGPKLRRGLYTLLPARRRIADY